MKKYAIGVDIGGMTIKFGLFNACGELLDKWVIKTRTENNGANVLPDIADSIKSRLAEREIDIDEVCGAGIGIPGPVDDAGNVNKCANIGWGVTPVEDILSKNLGIRVKAGNDANVAALGEIWKGAATGYKSAVMVTLGTGVGGGIVIDNKIISGVHGAGGEIGHIPINTAETDICGCGKRGCLEQYCSATGIVRLMRKYLRDHDVDTSVIDNEELSAKDIIDAAKSGDKAALAVFEEVTDYLGQGLAIISCIADPEVFIIGGGVSHAGDFLLDKVKAKFIPMAFHACRDTHFVLAELGNDAGIYGAARLVIE